MELVQETGIQHRMIKEWLSRYAKEGYEFLRKKLNHQLSDESNFATDYLLTKHAELFPAKEKADQ